VLFRSFRGHPQRRDAVDVLARRTQGLAAGRHHARVWIGAQQCLSHAGRGLDHVLAVVQDHQDVLVAERGRHVLGRLGSGGDPEPESDRDGRRDQAGIRQRRELGDPDSVGVLGQPLPGDLEGQSRLADTAGADQGDESVHGEHLRDLREGALPADQLRGRSHQVRRRKHVGHRRRHGGHEVGGRTRHACRRAGRTFAGAGPDWARVPYVVVELGGLGLGFGVELSAEPIHALLVLVQCGLPTSESRVQAHHRAMNRLLQRVEREQVESSLHSRLQGADLLLMGEQARHGLDRQLAQALALERQPLLERWLGHGQAVQ
jgi:hypothetical protein